MLAMAARIRCSGVFWGSLAGFMSLLVNVGAPPYQIHILPQRLDKLTLVGTTTIFFAFMNEMKIVPYFVLGQFSMRNFATSLALLPLAVAANYLGIWLVHKTPTERVLSDRLRPDVCDLARAAVAEAGSRLAGAEIAQFALFAVGSNMLLTLKSSRERETWRRRPTTPISTATRRISSR